MVGNESRHVQSMVDTIVGFVDGLYVAQIVDRQVELVSYSDGEPMGDEALPMAAFPDRELAKRSRRWRR